MILFSKKITILFLLTHKKYIVVIILFQFKCVSQKTLHDIYAMSLILTE